MPQDASLELLCLATPLLMLLAAFRRFDAWLHSFRQGSVIAAAFSGNNTVTVEGRGRSTAISCGGLIPRVPSPSKQGASLPRRLLP